MKTYNTHAIYLLIPSSVCGQDTQGWRIYCLSVTSSPQVSLMHTIVCFPLIHHCDSTVRQTLLIRR